MKQTIDTMHACNICVKGMDINTITKLSKRLKAVGYTVQWLKSGGHIDGLYIHLFMHVVREVDTVYTEDKVDSIALAQWLMDNGGSVSICL